MKKLFFIVAALGIYGITYSQVHANREALAKDSIYRAAPEKINDLVHTKMEARFDYDKSYMYGKVWITLQPHFYATDSLLLDAKGMDIKSVAIMKGNTSTQLKYDYDGMKLNVKLNKTYQHNEQYTVYIDYTAKPNELKQKGSAAITEAKGLYFINPKGEDKNKPTQIWTQGETEATSVWCPTIDKPNQKTTNEFYLTVPDKYVTLSNGLLISQKKNSDGTRTDYWKMDLPHAPYLFFMGIGDYTIVKDTYKGKEVSYYVEKEYGPVAKRIFGNTPEMIAFYEKITGVAYPWQKYSQITGRDYVSGAMENTTATLHQEGAQQDARELVDENAWESTIAHELFHHWFGDYVTTESWSNLTLNESFANYSETLWAEYKYGKDAGDEKNYNDMKSYLTSNSDNKDLVRYYYHDKEDMFDAVSYNKGGRILHMLRNYVGDSAFFKALNIYLTTYKFKTAEAHNLRMAFEEVTGKDMNWFFNQWYFGAGHPQLSVEYAYNDAAKQVKVTIQQMQEGSKVFRLPFAVDVYNGSNKKRYMVELTEKKQDFIFSYSSRPDLVNIDADKMLLCEKMDDKTIGNYIHQYKYAATYLDRREAVEYCASKQTNNTALDLLKLALNDKYYGIREFALSKLDMQNPAVASAMEPIIANMAKTDKKSTVRAEAIRVLGEYENAKYKDVFTTAINDSSYSVAGQALNALAKLDNDAALQKAREIKNQPAKGDLAAAISKILISAYDENDFDYIVGVFDKLPLSDTKLDMLEPFSKYIGNIKSTDKVKKGVDMIVTMRNSIPQQYKDQLAPYFNEVILAGILNKKQTRLIGPDSEAAKEQVNYIKAKMKEEGK